MKEFLCKLSLFALGIAICIAAAPPGLAQPQGATTRVFTTPPGLEFYVDGQIFTGTSGFVWPAGSKHTLYVNAMVQNDPIGTTHYAFVNWATGTTTLPQNPLIVTADPSLPEFHAVFSVAYELYLRYYPCSDPTTCQSPGTVYVNGNAMIGDQNLFFSAGTQVLLQAAPGPGYIFGGWTPGPYQHIQGFLDTVTMNAPVLAAPQFQVARTVNFSTVPQGFSVLLDRTPVTTPTSIQWGWGSTHTVGPVSPQQDSHGSFWVFSSWSDGGASTHAYVVGQSLTPDSLTATYVQAEGVYIGTSPPGFQVTVDGRNNWPSNNFTWGAGETHTIAAPVQQTDPQGRTWLFTGWSNGGPPSQTFTVPNDPASLAKGIVLIATYQPMGRLTVSSSLPGIAVQVDGSPCNTPCDIQRPQGTQVKVSAAASVPLAPGSRADFLGWSDGAAGDHTVTLGANPVSLMVSYHVMNLLTTASMPPNGATWQLQPASPDGFYDSQSSVSINVTPLLGYRFRQWAGDLSGISPAGTLAMSAPRSVQAMLDVVPFIAPPGVVNAAATTPNPVIAPGSIASLFGGLLGSDTELGPTNPLVQSLAGVTVTIGDRILPLYFVSPTQINFQLPADFPPGPAVLTVIAPSQTLNASFTVAPNAPGLFQQTVNNQNFAVALHADGSPVNGGSPAQQGETLTLLGTGFGSTNPSRPSGFAVPSQPPFLLAAPVTIFLGSDQIVPDSASAAPSLIGVDAIQFHISDTSLSGTNATLSVGVNGQTSNTVFLPVQ
jgi:uncharacterized protein (TIGR03437 family)